MWVLRGTLFEITLSIDRHNYIVSTTLVFTIHVYRDGYKYADSSTRNTGWVGRVCAHRADVLSRV